VSREEFDQLKSLVGQVLNELKQVQEVNKSLVE
jgi:hypothetical protein